MALGKVISSFDSPGTSPQGLTWDGTYLWNADASSKIYKLDTGGKAISFIRPGSYAPTGSTGLTWDGRYFRCANTNARKIYKFDRSGKAISSFDSPGTSPRGLTWDGTYLWNADASTKIIYRKSGGYWMSPFFSPASPTGLAWDGDYFWCASASARKIYKFDRSGKVISSFDSPGISPQGLAWDGTYLWNADASSKIIYQLSTTTSMITVDSSINLLTTSAVKANTQQILVTSSFSPVYSEAENTKEFRIVTSNIKNIRSGIGGHREANSHIESISSYSPDPEYAKQIRSEMGKIRSSTYIKRTRAVSSNINILQSSAKKHYDRNASTVTAIFSSAEIGPVTKASMSHININSKIVKLAKITADPSFFKKIITEAITSSVSPKGLERLPHNYNKSPGSNNWKLITIIQDEITKINQKAENISKMQNIDDAFGTYLDRHGENLQLKRGNKPDAIYRIALKAKLQRNISRGSVNEIIEIIATMLNIERSEVRIEENPGNEPASVYVEVPIAPLAKFGLSYDTFADIVDGVMAAGITLYSLTQGTYTYGDIDYEYNEEQGLADATDPDRAIGGYFGAWTERGI